MNLGREISLAGMSLLLMLLTACTSIGPPSVARDRFDYTTSVADSWKRQMLINIVKIRYGDAPIFLDVASITNQYQLTTDLNASLSWQFPPSGFNTQKVGVDANFVDRPTITYTPADRRQVCAQPYDTDRAIFRHEPGGGGLPDRHGLPRPRSLGQRHP